MIVRVDPSSSAPLFEQIAASIRMDAAAGRMRPGDRLPAARELARALEVNLHTVLHAYQRLRDERLVDLRPGRGAVVTGAVAPLADLHDDITALAARARALSLSPDTLAALVKEAAHDR